MSMKNVFCEIVIPSPELFLGVLPPALQKRFLRGAAFETVWPSPPDDTGSFDLGASPEVWGVWSC